MGIKNFTKIADSILGHISARTFFRSFCAQRSSFLGFSLIEIVLAIGMLMVALISVSSYYMKVLDVSNITTQHIQSGFLLEEGFEAAKLWRDQSWSANIATLSTTTTYYFYWTGTVWTATTSKQVIENTFTRSFDVKDVKRNGVSYDVSSSGIYDPGTKKIIVNVSWMRKGGAVATDTAETYIMNLFNN